MTVEYTAEMTADLVERYTAAVEAGADYDTRTALVKELAAELTEATGEDVSVASVRGKLTAEKVYVRKAKEGKTSTDSTSKDEYVKALRAVTGLSLKSVDKATKADVKALFEFITTASDQMAAEAAIGEVEA
jgi:hypothetical protein